VTGRSGAGFGRRFAALLYDGLLLFALLMIYTAVALAFTPGHVALSTRSSGGWFYAYRAGEVALIGGYYVLNWTRSGQTLGMRAWRLRLIDVAGRTPTVRAAVLRFLWGFLAWPPAGLGVLWLYWDKDRLAVHDRFSGTRVVRLTRAA
jgi:uncharacterized RDD family membrane protein YckC